MFRGSRAWRSILLALLTVVAVAADQDARRDFDRAAALLSSGEESQALISYFDFLRRYPQTKLAVEAQFQVAEIYRRSRQWEKALAEYRKVLKLDDKEKILYPETTFQIGDCLFKLKKFPEARIEWEALIRRFPKSDAAQQARVNLAAIPSNTEVSP